jgi:serine/threonine protein kinase
MELMKGGQLSELIKKKKSENKKFTDEEGSAIMRCIL